MSCVFFEHDAEENILVTKSFHQKAWKTVVDYDRPYGHTHQYVFKTK